MRILELVERMAAQAHSQGGPTFLEPDGPPRDPQSATLPGEADLRWRPAPNPSTGALFLDPEFTLPSIAGPVTWRLFYDSGTASTDSEWGYGHRCSFNPHLIDNVADVTVYHEDGGAQSYTESGGIYQPTGVPNGDQLQYMAGTGWTEVLGETGMLYQFPDASDALATNRITPQQQRLTYNYSGGLLRSIVDPAQRRITLSYNADGKVQTIEDWGERGLVVLTYVGSDLTEVWEQEDAVTRYRYDSGHRLTYICDPESYVTTYTWDSRGRVYTRSVAGNLGRYPYVSGGVMIADDQTGYTDPLVSRPP